MTEELLKDLLAEFDAYTPLTRKRGIPIGSGKIWRYFKNGLTKRSVCNKCQKVIAEFEPCYTKSVGTQHKHTVSYCVKCYEGLWFEHKREVNVDAKGQEKRKDESAFSRDS